MVFGSDKVHCFPSTADANVLREHDPDVVILGERPDYLTEIELSEVTSLVHEFRKADPTLGNPRRYVVYYMIHDLNQLILPPELCSECGVSEDAILMPHPGDMMLSVDYRGTHGSFIPTTNTVGPRHGDQRINFSQVPFEHALHCSIDIKGETDWDGLHSSPMIYLGGGFGQNQKCSVPFNLGTTGDCITPTYPGTRWKVHAVEPLAVDDGDSVVYRTHRFTCRVLYVYTGKVYMQPPNTTWSRHFVGKVGNSSKKVYFPYNRAHLKESSKSTTATKYASEQWRSYITRLCETPPYDLLSIKDNQYPASLIQCASAHYVETNKSNQVALGRKTRFLEKAAAFFRFSDQTVETISGGELYQSDTFSKEVTKHYLHRDGTFYYAKLFGKGLVIIVAVVIAGPLVLSPLLRPLGVAVPTVLSSSGATVAVQTAISAVVITGVATVSWNHRGTIKAALVRKRKSLIDRLITHDSGKPIANTPGNTMGPDELQVFAAETYINRDSTDDDCFWRKKKEIGRLLGSEKACSVPGTDDFIDLPDKFNTHLYKVHFCNAFGSEITDAEYGRQLCTAFKERCEEIRGLPTVVYPPQNILGRYVALFPIFYPLSIPMRVPIDSAHNRTSMLFNRVLKYVGVDPVTQIVNVSKIVYLEKLISHVRNYVKKHPCDFAEDRSNSIIDKAKKKVLLWGKHKKTGDTRVNHDLVGKPTVVFETGPKLCEKVCKVRAINMQPPEASLETVNGTELYEKAKAALDGRELEPDVATFVNWNVPVGDGYDSVKFRVHTFPWLCPGSNEAELTQFYVNALKTSHSLHKNESKVNTIYQFITTHGDDNFGIVAIKYFIGDEPKFYIVEFEGDATRFDSTVSNGFIQPFLELLRSMEAPPGLVERFKQQFESGLIVRMNPGRNNLSVTARINPIPLATGEKLQMQRSGMTTTSFLNSFAMMVAVLGSTNSVSLLDEDSAAKVADYFSTLSIIIKFKSRVWEYQKFESPRTSVADSKRSGKWKFDWNNLPIFSCTFLKGHFTYEDMGDLDKAFYCPLLPSRFFKAAAGTNTPPSKIVAGRRKSISDPDAAAVLYLTASVAEYRKFAHDYFTKLVMERLCPGDLDEFLDKAMANLGYPPISYNKPLTMSNDPKFQAQKSYTQRQQKYPRSQGRSISISGEESSFMFMEDRYNVSIEEIKEFLDFLSPSGEGYTGRTYIAHPLLVKLFDADY